jgi:2-polyprenyl-6-methoxyphenol hydroxylase-like FAD-dependent oxidoreductase
VTRRRHVLVTGASIAGPAVAWQLVRRGFEVTLVERAPTIRTGGYAIDIRGSAIDVVDRMGILPAARAAHVATRRVTFLDGRGRPAAVLDPTVFGVAAEGRHVELPRGILTSLLFEAARPDIQCRFGDAIVALDEDPDGVDVEFRSGVRERFDLVVSGEGLHSTTRELVFGPEDPFSHYLGYCFAICELANTWGLRREAMAFNRPGRAAILYSTSDGPTLFALFAHRRPPLSAAEIADPALQVESLVHAFQGDGWHVPEMLAGLEAADDVYCDATTQIRMPAWSKGRVALLGDAAFAPSFFTGQGTSLALVGAYVLAGALATCADHAAAFRAYDEITRPYVVANQATVKDGSTIVAPGTALEIWLRNAVLRLAPLAKRAGLLGRMRVAAHEGLDLPAFEPEG